MAVFGRPVQELDADECLDMEIRIAGEQAQLSAWRCAVWARFAQLRPPLPGDQEGAARGFGEFAADELSAVARMAPGAASSRLEVAVALADRLPGTLAALEAGEIDADRAQAVATVTKTLDADQARRVEERVLPRGPRASYARFRAAVTRSVLAVDPDGAERRRRRRNRDRHVRCRPADDSMGTLTALLPAERMVAAYRRIDELARRAGGPDDDRKLGERRADVLVDLLMGVDHGPVGAEVGVVVPLTVLMGLSDSPGELEGYGPIPAELARELAMGSTSTWRRLVTDPVDGSIVDVSDRRYPSPALARLIMARDRQCIFPGCPKPARNCDLDHTNPYGVDGRTSKENLGPACRHHHRMKHAGHWTLSQPQPGHFVWTSPTGRQFVVEPEPYLDEGGGPTP